MLKMQINYEDFDGNTQQEDLYFNLNKREVVTLADRLKGLGEVAKRVAKGRDLKDIDPSELGKAILADGGASIEMIASTIDTIIDMSYGVRSEDGKKFIKGDEVVAEFKQTLAYDAFIDKLLEDEHYAATFIQAMTPKVEANTMAQA